MHEVANGFIAFVLQSAREQQTGPVPAAGLVGRREAEGAGDDGPRTGIAARQVQETGGKGALFLCERFGSCAIPVLQLLGGPLQLGFLLYTSLHTRVGCI